MSAKPPFFRLHYITLLIAALLAVTAISIQYIHSARDVYTLFLTSSKAELNAIRNVNLKYGWPYPYEFHNHSRSQWRTKTNKHILEDCARVGIKVNDLSDAYDNLRTPSALRENAPAIYELLQRPTSADYSDKSLFNSWSIHREDGRFHSNILVLAGAITAISLLLEILLRAYERRALQPARIAAAALHYSDLRFSLLAMFITSITFSALLAVSLHPNRWEELTNLEVKSNSSDVKLIVHRNMGEKRGWPWEFKHYVTQKDISITLPLSSPEGAEASQLQPPSPNILQSPPPWLWDRVFKASENAFTVGGGYFDTTRLIQNLITCFAIAFTVGLLIEFLVRRQRKTPTPTTDHRQNRPLPPFAPLD